MKNQINGSTVKIISLLIVYDGIHKLRCRDESIAERIDVASSTIIYN